jgi:hypothetical protein
MPKKSFDAPVTPPRYLKFRFHVPVIAPVTVGASKLPMAREKCKGMVQHGDFVLSADFSQARAAKSSPDNWPAELAWICPDCKTENWFLLSRGDSRSYESCKDRCRDCSKTYVVVEGYIHRMESGCDTCDKRIECLLIQRAEVVTLSMEEAL